MDFRIYIYSYLPCPPPPACRRPPLPVGDLSHTRPSHVAEAVWRGAGLGHSDTRTVQSDFPALNAELPDGGWSTHSLSATAIPFCPFRARSHLSKIQSQVVPFLRVTFLKRLQFSEKCGTNSAKAHHPQGTQFQLLQSHDFEIHIQSI